MSLCTVKAREDRADICSPKEKPSKKSKSLNWVRSLEMNQRQKAKGAWNQVEIDVGSGRQPDRRTRQAGRKGLKATPATDDLQLSNSSLEEPVHCADNFPLLFKP